MKRYLRVVAAALLFLGCAKKGPDDRALFNQVQPLSDAVLANPQGATPAQVAQAIDALEAVAQQAPGLYGGGRAEQEMARIYMARGEPAKAREQCKHIFWYYHQFPDLGMTALISIAKSYEAEQNWKAAEKAYKTIDDHYQWWPLWLEAPLYPGQMYERIGDRQRAAEAYERAVLLLQRRVPSAPNPWLEGKATMHLATAYDRLGQWKKAAAILEALVSPLRKGVEPGAVLLQLADLYAAPGRDPAKAAAALKRIVQEFPGDPLASKAKTQLEQLEGAASSQSAASSR